MTYVAPSVVDAPSTPAADTIVSWYNERLHYLAPVHGAMRALAEAVDGEMDIPLPELDRAEKPMTANLISQGLDQISMRIASTTPDVEFPATRDNSEAADSRARTRREATLGWWTMSRMNLQLRQRARYLVGYGCAPALIRPDFKRRAPKWEVHNPLSTFPPPGDDLTPLDCIYLTRHSLAHLRSYYPDKMGLLSLGPDPKPDTMFDCLYYVDDQVMVSVVLGRSLERYTETTSQGLYIAGTPWRTQRGLPYVELERAPNRAGICPVVIPARIPLSRRQGQFDSQVGTYWNLSKLLALEVIGIQRSIFRDEWITSPQQGVPATVIQEADGMRGIRGELQGGDIKALDLSPGFQTWQLMNYLERNMRVSAGIPAEFGGESVTNVRTGRRGQQIMSAAVDYTIAEAQEIFQTALQEENIRAIAIDKAYWGSESKSFYFTWRGERGRGTYTPEETWETDEHTVRYSMPGLDASGLRINLLQAVGAEMVSKHTGRRIDPLVEDPDFEERQVIRERLQAAELASLEQGAASSALPIVYLARIDELVARGAPLFKAIQTADREARERQASAGELGAPDGPVPPGSPEAMPGLAPPGIGAEAPAAIGPPDASAQNLSQLLGSLRRPQMMLPQEG